MPKTLEELEKELEELKKKEIQAQIDAYKDKEEQKPINKPTEITEDKPSKTLYEQALEILNTPIKK